MSERFPKPLRGDAGGTGRGTTVAGLLGLFTLGSFMPKSRRRFGSLKIPILVSAKRAPTLAGQQLFRLEA